MYQLTINSPLEKGYTHEQIVEIIRCNFKTINYFCMADEEEYLTCTLDNKSKEFDDVCDKWEFDCEMC